MGAGSEVLLVLGVVVVLVELIRTDERTDKTTRVRVGSESATLKGGVATSWRNVTTSER